MRGVYEMSFLKYLLILFLLLILSTGAVLAEDNSLWNEESGSIYQDQPRYVQGDIIRVIIKEDASAIQSANTSTAQGNNVEADSGVGLLDFIKGFAFSYSDSGSADGETKRSGTLEADITTQVIKVMESGNLKISGIKLIKINGEEQEIRLSGIIRPDDIELDNTISSKKIADAKIESEGEGPVSEKQQPGLLERLFNFIF